MHLMGMVDRRQNCNRGAEQLAVHRICSCEATIPQYPGGQPLRHASKNNLAGKQTLATTGICINKARLGLQIVFMGTT